MAKQDNKAFFSEWLEKLQQESWQLELLISGLALFGIFESQDLLIEFKMYTSNNSEGIIRVTQSFFISILGVGWKIFFINLLIHVVLRGLWIGAIGLRYVSHDIDYDALNYSEYFTKMLRDRVGEFDDFIERLEKICSVLFAYTFLLFLLFFSFSFFFFQVIFVANFVDSAAGSNQALWLGIAIVLYLLVGLIVFIDFITLGVLKKVEEKTINKIYGYIFTFYGWTTLTFLYRPLLYNFLDNRYTKRLFFFSIPYILIILLFSKMFSNNNFVFYPPSSNAQQFGKTINRMNYEDLRKEYLSEVEPRVSKRRQVIPNIILNKYMNDEDYLRIFMKMNPTDYMQIQENENLDPYWKSGFNFTLFTTKTYKDRFYKEGNEALNVELESVRLLRRELRKKKRHLKDSIQIKTVDTQIDSLSEIITTKRNQFNEKGILYEEEKQTKTINAILDLSEIEINGSDIRENMDCYFFEHSNNNEKGVMCLYSMDSLSFGKHELYFYKEIVTSRSGDNKRKITLKIPFYKVSSCN